MNMAESKRVELLASILKKDSSDLIKIVKQLSSEDSLIDTLLELNKRQLEELWDGSLQICTSTLMSSDGEDYNPDHINEICEVLHCIITLANATLSSMLKTKPEKGEQSELTLPHSLTEAAIIIHDIFPTLTIEKNNLKDHICRLFETWWVNGFPGREELMGNTIYYLLTKSTQAKSTQADVNRVKAVQKMLSVIDLSDENAGALIPLLLQCTYHPQFVNTPMGINFLSYLFTLDASLMEKIHMSIRNHILNVPKLWHKKYGEIYLRAWQKSTGELKEALEQNCIQDIMYRAVHANRGQHCQVFNTLFKILSHMHKEKTKRGVEAMLTKLYEPILWRSLMVANSDVRANAATLMFDVFPLFDPSLHNEQSDMMLQKQFDLMQSLLSDPVPEVRLIAVKGVGHVLNIYWELIPAQVIQFFITSLVQDQVYDVTSPSARESVLKVMSELCDNHLCITMLKTILPELRDFIHDKSEKVRLAMLELLLKVKRLRAIKFYHIVPVEHILARLEIDSAPVCQRIMKLTHNSFVPIQQQPEELVKRCIALIGTNRGAARQFFTRLPEYLSLEDSVRYMIVLCRYMLHQLELIAPNLPDASDGSIDESVNGAPNGASSSKGKRAPPAKRTHKQRKVDKSAEMEGTDGTTAEDFGNEEEEEDQDVMTSMCGMVEAIYLMLTPLLSKLSSSENKALKEGLNKKLCVTVRKLMAVSQGTEMDSALVALAGHLPGKALPLIGQNLFNRLKQVCRQKEVKDITVIIKSLVLWGKAESVMELVRDSLMKTFSDREPQKAQERLPDELKKKKKTVGFTAEEEPDINLEWALNIVVKMMTLAECRAVLLVKHRKSLALLVKTLKPVLQLVKDFLQSTQSTYVPEVNVLLQVFAVYTRLTTFLCLPDSSQNAGDWADSDTSACTATMGNILDWTLQAVVPHLNTGDEARLGVSREVTVTTLKVVCGALMVNIYDEFVLVNLVQLCQTVLENHVLDTALSFQALACLLQLTQLRKPQSDQANDSHIIRGFDRNVFACIKSFLTAYINHLVTSENIEEGLDSGSPGFLEKLSPVLINIVHELTRTGRSLEIAGMTLKSVMLCAIEETKYHCQKNGLKKETSLPPLSTTLLNFVIKRSSLRRLFIQELERYLNSKPLFDINDLCSLVTITVWLETGSSEDMGPLTNSVNKLVSEAQVEQTADRDMKRLLEEAVCKWGTPNAEPLTMD